MKLKILLLVIGLISCIIHPLYSQKHEKGGFIMGGNTMITFSDEKQNEKRFYSNLRLDFDFGFCITDKSQIGYRQSLILKNSKSETDYENTNEWISSCYFNTKITHSVVSEIHCGYGKDHFKGEIDDGFKGAHDWHITEFGMGIQYHIFLSEHLILIPKMSYNHSILFLKHFENFTSNQHINQVIFYIGLYYYFNIN